MIKKFKAQRRVVSPNISFITDHSRNVFCEDGIHGDDTAEGLSNGVVVTSNQKETMRWLISCQACSNDKMKEQDLLGLPSLFHSPNIVVQVWSLH